jgi:uncharacterized protein YidB (DUF937 family)
VTDISKLSRLLDDPEVRVVVYGLAHVEPAQPSAQPGAPRLRAVVADLADATEPDQYSSWLSEDTPNRPMTAEQVRLALGDDAINDLAGYTGSTAADLSWQLTAVLPDLVDAISPGGTLMESSELDQELRAVTMASTRSSGPFGPRVH